MRLKEENPELNGIVKSYNLRGFSFREFINLQTGNSFQPYTLDEILRNHEHIIKQISAKGESDEILPGLLAPWILSILPGATATSQRIY